MILGDANLFTKEHCEAHAGVAPPYLCELVVYSLELVAQLARAGLEFRFKGGNSQLVLLEDPQRFSIDADIVTRTSKEELKHVVGGIADLCPVFQSWEVRQHKTKPWLPMISFKLFFESHFQPSDDAFVMLDAVLEEAPYPGVRRPVRCGSLYSSQEEVEVPTISGLIGDKLLCIGPATLGIPLGKKKEAQRLKHVFDVAFLSSHDHELHEVLSSMVACMAQENRIQKSEWSTDQVFADTREFLSAALDYDTPPGADSLEVGTYLDEVVRGFEGFRPHVFGSDYTWARFRADCRRITGLLDSLEAELAD